LQDARRYDRIAGFFSSSLLELAGEALERMKPEDGNACVRVVCNSSFNPLDVQTARAAKWGMHREWCASLPAEIGASMKARLQRLYDFLQSGLLKVKVLPDEAFGLIHGKAGVITRTDGSQVCFIGSANESRTACDIRMITDLDGGLLISEFDYTYPVWIYDVSRADIGYDQTKAKQLRRQYE